MRQDTPTNAEKPTDTQMCMGTTEKGLRCKNKAMNGFEYCREHQPTCSYKSSDAKTCRNFVIGESKLCAFHSPVESSSSSTTNKPLTSISRRDFILFKWPLKLLKAMNSSVDSIPKPVKVIVGGVLGTKIAEYLITDALDYFKEKHGIKYLFPLSFEETEQVENVKSRDVSDDSSLVRVVNETTTPVSVSLDFVDYSTGQHFSSYGIAISPSHSYVDLTTMPDGFHGGVTVSSEQPVKAIAIVKLRILTEKLDPYNEQFLDFTIPLSKLTPLIVTNVKSMIVLGKNQNLSHASDIQCVVRQDRIYFDRETILELIQKTHVVDGLVIVQLEGEFLINQETHELAGKYMPGYSAGQAEKRFETTAEVVAIVI